jgi:hypothetical protein
MTRKQTLGPIARTVIAQRRAGVLDSAADDPLVYLLLLRAAVESDRLYLVDRFRALPRPRPTGPDDQGPG